MTISYSKSKKNKRINGFPEEHKQLLQIVLDDPHWGQELVRYFICRPNVTLLSHSIPQDKTMLYGYSIRMKAVARDMDGTLYNVRILWQEEKDAYNKMSDLVEYFDAERTKDHELVIVAIIEDESAFPPGISCTRVIYPDQHLMKVELNRPHFDADHFAAMNITIREVQTDEQMVRHMS